jgi:hypothetical protein
VVALGACSALADLAAGQAARRVLFNSAQLAVSLGVAGAVYGLAGGDPGPRPGPPGGGPAGLVSAMLLGMAPVVTVVAGTSLALLPILGLPTAAVYLARRGAIRADRERAGPRPRPSRPGRPRPSGASSWIWPSARAPGSRS